MGNGVGGKPACRVKAPCGRRGPGKAVVGQGAALMKTPADGCCRIGKP